MGHHLDAIIAHKYFYRNNFRKLVKWLFFSMMLMAILSISIFFLVVTKRTPAYYATNSAGFITPLRVLDGPNMSSQAILKPDPPEEVAVKELTVGAD